MVEHEKFESFLESIPDGLPDYLIDLEIENIKNNVPIIRKGGQRLLRFMLAYKNPGNILEIGTATGFSALYMLNFVKNTTKITTIESLEERADKASGNFVKYDKLKQIRLLRGDALEILPELAAGGDSYDFVFMDAAKGQYINFLPSVKKLLAPKGILVSDNLLQEGRLLDSRYTVVRRERTIHSRMREYIKAVLADEEMETMLLEAGDGMSVSFRK